MKPINYYAVVPAAGVGKRMQADVPKQYLRLAGKTVLEQTLNRLLAADIFTAISISISKEDPYWTELDVAKNPKIITAEGGIERADSVLSALKALEDVADKDDWVLVHDAARPCITSQDIMLLINRLKNETFGGILALSSHDTLKQVTGETIQTTLDRSTVWRALTPQMFRYGVLKKALEQTKGNLAVTDEASAVELTGGVAKIIEGRADNIKITRPEDLALAEFYLEKQ